MKNQRKVTQYPDGTLKVEVIDNRDLNDSLVNLSFKDKLDVLYPTSMRDITQEWCQFDAHKRGK